MNISTIRITRKNALSVYTSVITACDHITSLTEKIRAPAMPPTRPILSRIADESLSQNGLTTSRKLAALREIRSATRPLVTAPQTAEKRFTRHATLPNGSLVNNHVRIDQSG